MMLGLSIVFMAVCPRCSNSITTMIRLSIYKTYSKKLTSKDIVARNNIQNSEEMEELLSVIASNIGSLTNPQKLANTFKSKKNQELSAPTIKQYLDYLQDAF